MSAGGPSARAENEARSRPATTPHPVGRRVDDDEDPTFCSDLCNPLSLPPDLALFLTSPTHHDTFMCPNCLASTHQARWGRREQGPCARCMRDARAPARRSALCAKRRARPTRTCSAAWWGRAASFTTRPASTRARKHPSSGESEQGARACGQGGGAGGGRAFVRRVLALRPATQPAARVPCLRQGGRAYRAGEGQVESAAMRSGAAARALEPTEAEAATVRLPQPGLGAGALSPLSCGVPPPLLATRPARQPGEALLASRLQ